MDNFYVDLFVTKGLEYLLVIFFLVTLVIFWRILHKPANPLALESSAGPLFSRVEWFALADELYYHQGHSWARPDGEDVVLIGMDDFAQHLLGRADKVDLPAVGARLEQGESAWKLRYHTSAIDLVSPVSGKVVDVNREVLHSPALINDDPYGKGWILKVHVPKLRANLRNLLHGNLARSWTEETVRSLRQLMSPASVPALQDGGVLVSGFARVLSPDHWEEIARRFLLTE